MLIDADAPPSGEPNQDFLVLLPVSYLFSSYCRKVILAAIGCLNDGKPDPDFLSGLMIL
jgi:hypothetical protein